MTSPESMPFRPDYAIPPGDSLRSAIEAIGMTQADLAKRTGLSTKHVNQIMQGLAPISPDTALALERVLRVPARFWNTLEANHQARQSRLRDDAAADADVDWVACLPTRELVRRRFIAATTSAADLRDQLLAFFGVASRQSWEALWRAADAAFRRSKVFEADPYAIAAWLRIGELRAAGVETEPFDRGGFQAALATIRNLMKEPPEVFEPRMKALCAETGVVVVIVEEIKGSRAHGATRWLSPSRALIQLSLRYKWEDVFWFSFFHEAGHVLMHGKRDAFVDDSKSRSTEEDEADAFARDHLIPVAYQADLLRVRTPLQARALASKMGIPTGIVVGRLQHEGLMPYNVGNGDRRQFRLVEDPVPG
jgi:HTH-type transcriptional regulator/antitoxin HigA